MLTQHTCCYAASTKPECSQKGASNGHGGEGDCYSADESRSLDRILGHELLDLFFGEGGGMKVLVRVCDA